MRGRLRLEKRGAELADGCEVFAKNHRTVARLHLLAPISPGLPLLKNADALAQPARHLVFREREGHDVTELMPEDGLPRVGRVGSRRRRIRGDNASEADAEIARAARQ